MRNAFPLVKKKAVAHPTTSRPSDTSPWTAATGPFAQTLPVLWGGRWTLPMTKSPAQPHALLMARTSSSVVDSSRPVMRNSAVRLGLAIFTPVSFNTALMASAN